MKRSKELRPLSVEHHHALFQILQLRRALKGELNINEVVSNFLKEWEAVIEPHFLIEENILIPAYLNNNNNCSQDLVDMFYQQHTELRQLLIELKKSKNNVASVINIADALQTHIRFEEQKLFPAIESSLNQTDALKLGNKLNSKCHNYDQS